MILCGATSSQRNPVSVSDGLGGALVTWIDNRPMETAFFGQRVNSQGTTLWQTDGILVAGDGEEFHHVSDNRGGLIGVWRDRNANPNTNIDVRAQRFSAGGSPLWGTGVVVSAAPNSQDHPAVISDNTGGATVEWEDWRTWTGPGYVDLYAQRLDSLGNVLWTNDGIQVSTRPDLQNGSVLVGDNSGGMIVAFKDSAIYAQWVGPQGQLTSAKLDEENSPVLITLLQNYPNPFNPTTTITYDLPSRQEVRLGVHDLLGREVDVLASGIREQGRHQYKLDGSRMASGMYFVRLTTSEVVRTSKILLLK